MQRKAWFELHDHRLYPGFLRDLVTDALQGVWNSTEIYFPIARRLERSIEASGAKRIIDLCSGAGGPWIGLTRKLKGDESIHPAILLTDKYPRRGAIRTIQDTASGLSFYPDAVDAVNIPSDLTGFRTIFSTFHHFGPSEAHAILKNSFQQGQGIGIFEAAKRDLRTVAGVIVVPLLTLRITPRIRPFCWSRIFWTYLLPVIPLTLWLDGMLSCLRAYTLADLRELTLGLKSDTYRWEIGEEQGGPVPITYLVGYPCLPAQNGNADPRPAHIDKAQMKKPA